MSNEAVFDADSVLARSTSLILDPLAGHRDNARRIDDPDMRETIMPSPTRCEPTGKLAVARKGRDEEVGGSGVTGG